MLAVILVLLIVFAVGGFPGWYGPGWGYGHYGGGLGLILVLLLVLVLVRGS